MMAPRFHLRPGFLNQQSDGPAPYRGLFNYRRIWAMSVALLAAVALIPLTFITYMDYAVTRNAIMSENLLRTVRTTSNTRRTVTYFLEERRAALEFISRTTTVSELTDEKRLADLLHGLKESFGGFADLGFIDDTGRQLAYVGPFPLQGKNYSEQSWFTHTLEQGSYVSDVFLGYRDLPHLVVAVRFDCPKGRHAMLRATIDTERFRGILAGLDLSAEGDAFIVNHAGVLQTPSRRHGDVLDVVDLPVPQYTPETRVLEVTDGKGREQVLGCAYIDGTPFVLMVVKDKARLMVPITNARNRLFFILAISVLVIVMVIVLVATSMVARIHMADQTRVKTVRQMEHTNRMASIGRLAAGVAHEVNNPLAIINEKAGLIRDLLTYGKETVSSERLLGLVDSVLASVERCGTITKRLLSFARQVDVTMEPLRVRKVVEDVLGFLTKEAEYRNIQVMVQEEEEVPEIVSDRGKLQQIFLNLVNNAFQAMRDGGHLRIEIVNNDDMVEARVADDGCGIAPENLERIFEPFFSTKKNHGGTGLGLSITYGLVKELGGEMKVQSKLGQGTTFRVLLPRTARPAQDGAAQDTQG